MVGQEAIARTLKNAIETDRVAHAYLFSGTRGVGKTTMARILAKALNCLAVDQPTVTPCCKCESCVAVGEGEDLDVLEIDAASNTGVDHIRELRQNAIYRPARARFKIYIIDEVHMLSTSAFNALLKTLEEPPDHVKFILATTEPNKVLATILSRCQRFDFRNIGVDDIAGQLQSVLGGEGVEAEEALVRRVARLAHGSMRDALSLLDQLLSMVEGKLTVDLLTELLGTPRSERIVDLVEAIGQGDLAEALGQVDGALGEGLALDQLADALQGHFRDLMVLRSCGAKTDLVNLDEPGLRDKALEQCEMFDEATLVYNITVTEELRRSLASGGAGRALLEAAIVRLTDAERFTDTRALLEQLQSSPAANPPAAPAPRSVSNRSVSRASGQVDQGKKTADTTSPKPVEEQKASRSTKAEGLKLPKSLDLQYFAEHWQQILALLSQGGAKHVGAYLKLSQPTDWQNDKLTVGYRSEQSGMRELLEERPEQVDEMARALATLLGQSVKLQLGELDEPAGAAPTSQAAPTAPAKRPPGSRPSQAEVNSAMDDAQVKQVQEILGGKVRQIDRLEEE